jgi:hypothetical protein
MERETGTTVYIAPSAHFEPDGRMVDPDTARFSVSWQSDDEDATGPIEEATITGASAAIEWGRERSEVVYIRLGHRGDTYFSAGDLHPEDEEEPPRWPPTGPPLGGWYTPRPDEYVD